MKKIIGIISYLLLSLGIFQLVKDSTMFITLNENPTWIFLRYTVLSCMLAFVIMFLLILYIKRKSFYPFLSKLYRFRSLLFQLVKRDFKSKYKRSVLGVLWSVLNPLLTMCVMTIVFSSIFRFDVQNYPVYLLSGQLIFTLFSEITNTCMFSVLASAPLMKKVNTPKYIFPLSKAISALINFFFSTIALLIVMFATGSPIYSTILLAPLPVLYIFVFSLGIGLILAAAIVYFRDMSYLYGVLITAVTYITPLFYPISIIPDHFKWLISINPLYHFVECFRTVAIYGGVPSLWQNLVCILLALVSLISGIIIFYRQQDRFILYV